MNKISKWLNVNKLSLKTVKTKFVLLRPRNKKSKLDLKFSINDENIKQVKNITFLGIIIDEFLTWRDHIDLVAKRIIKCFQNSTFYKSKTGLLCISLSIFYLWKPNMARCLQMSHSETNKYSNKDNKINDV